MATDKKISQLASGAPAQAGDEYVVARSGANYKLTLTNIAGNMPATTISSGNLTFSSTGQRITGDFSNATVANRVLFQSSTTNGGTEVGVMPNGTGTSAGWNVYGTPTTAATTVARFDIANNTETRLLSGRTDASVSFIPMTFYTGGSERMRLDTSGNLGIGTTPSAVLTPRLQISSAFSAATAGTPYNGVFVESSDAQAADKGGVISLGGLYDASSGSTRFAAIVGLKENGTSGNYAGYLAFYSRANGSSPAERMRIDSSGNVGIGGTPAASVKLNIQGTYPSSGGFCLPLTFDGTIPSSATSGVQIIRSNVSTQAASFTVGDFIHFGIEGVTKGAGSAVTNQYGVVVQSSFTGATNNYGFYSNIASGSNRWNFYAAGTAQNYFAGETLVGGTTDQGAYNLQCNGTGVWGAGAYVNGSDARIKEDVNPIASGLDVIEKLNPVTYRYKESWTKDQSIQTGFIAQELLTALEGQVYVDGVVQQGGAEGYYSVAYQNIIPILVKAIQELTARVAELEAK